MDDIQKFNEYSPVDNNNPQKTLFFILGNVAMLCFNVVISAVDIFEHFTGKEISGFLTRSYNIPSSITALLICIFKPKNVVFWISLSHIMLIIAMTIIPFVIAAGASAYAIQYSAMVCVGITGVFSSLAFSSTVSASSSFGADAATAFSSGQGCCGVLTNVLRMITKFIFTNWTASTLVYYLSTVALLAFSLVFFLLKAKRLGGLMNDCTEEPTNLKEIWSSSISTIKIVWPQLLGVFIGFFITLHLFPAYVIQVRQPSYLKSWTYVMITSVFCIFDWVGRWFPSIIIWPSPRWSLLPNVARAVFYLIFMISIQGLVDLNEPWWTTIWMIPFAFTNGYFTTVSLIYGSNHQDLELHQKRFAGFVVSFAINAGILLAMFMTFVLPIGKPIPY